MKSKVIGQGIGKHTWIGDTLYFIVRGPAPSAPEGRACAITLPMETAKEVRATKPEGFEMKHIAAIFMDEPRIVHVSHTITDHENDEVFMVLEEA